MVITNDYNCVLIEENQTSLQDFILIFLSNILILLCHHSYNVVTFTKINKIFSFYNV